MGRVTDEQEFEVLVLLQQCSGQIQRVIPYATVGVRQFTCVESNAHPRIIPPAEASYYAAGLG